MKSIASNQLLDLSLCQNKVFDGGWVLGATTKPVHEPATGKQLAIAGMADAKQISLCAEKAASVQREWAKVDCEVKRKLFTDAERLMRRHSDEIIELAMREIGATRSKAQFEIDFSADEILEAASYPTQHQGSVLPDKHGRFSFSKRVPYGVVAALTPSNVPILLAARVIAPALAMGNAVILKPHPHSILCGGFVFARIFEEAGFPAGVLQVLPSDGDDAKTFETDPNISMIHFTGSTSTAAHIAELGSKHLKKVSVSGSGKNPLIVLDDVSSLEAAVSTAIYSTFYFGGQSCMTAGRHIIQRSLYDEYCLALAKAASELEVGNPIENSNVFYGPMIDPGSVKRLYELVQDAISKGAELLCGGTSNGAFFAPTVLKGVNETMRAWQEEIFGPIAAITPFDNDLEAVELANSTNLGLSGAVLGSLGRAREIAAAMQTGMVHINDKTTDDSTYVPFGGVKGSGNGGRYGSYVNWDEYTQVRWFTESIEAKPVAGFKK